MKIDIGTNGKILGTKRVSPNGQISGFTEYAGLDVLVILPGDHRPVVRRDATDLLTEAETLVRQRMELAFREYQNLRQRFTTPEQATRTFLRRFQPKNFRGLLEKADEWIREQMAPEDGAPVRSKGQPRKRKE